MARKMKVIMTSLLVTLIFSCDFVNVSHTIETKEEQDD